MRAELAANGGKIIRISGGPQQPPREAIAKLIMHFKRWSDLLGKQDGVAIITGTSSQLRFRTPEQFAARLSKTDDQQFAGYEANPAPRRQQSVQSSIPDEQLPLD